MTAVERGGYADSYMPRAGQPSIPWSELDALHQRIGRHFARSEPRLRARRYIQGLLASHDRKNGRRLADFAEEQRPDGMQRLLTRASWSAEAVRDEVQDYVIERIGQESAILALVETVFERRGSAGPAWATTTVQRLGGSLTPSWARFWLMWSREKPYRSLTGDSTSLRRTGRCRTLQCDGPAAPHQSRWGHSPRTWSPDPDEGDSHGNGFRAQTASESTESFGAGSTRKESRMCFLFH
jgi:hypothetical protein